MNTLKTTSNKSLLTFFVIVILLSAAVETLICKGGSEWLYMALMWIPALAAVIAGCTEFKCEQRGFSLKSLTAGLGIHKCKARYIFMGLLLPLIYLLIPYISYWLLFPANFAYSGVALWRILINTVPVLLIGIPVSMVSALGEELGWRGFMLPALYERLGLNKTLVISSLFWCLWHFPLLISGGYMSGTPLWYQLPAFALCIFPVGVMAGLLTLKSGSVWPAAFLHAAHNNYDQAVFDLLTSGISKMYFVSETGAFTILCVWVLAILMYMYMKKSTTKGD